MFGALIGDIVGSRFEWNNWKSKDFDFFSEDCFVTDDSIMTLAICKAFLQKPRNTRELALRCIQCMQELGKCYPRAGYGVRFARWLIDEDPKPYESFGNGAAMRVSATAYVAKNEEEVKELSRAVTEISHNHPEGLKGAQATAHAIYLARTGKSQGEIRDVICANYYALDLTLAEIKADYTFNETCQNTVPQALQAFFEAKDFEDAIRNAISIGGDSDTLAAITGSVAEAYFGIPQSLRHKAIDFLDDRLLSLLVRFEAQYPGKIA